MRIEKSNFPIEVFGKNLLIQWGNIILTMTPLILIVSLFSSFFFYYISPSHLAMTPEISLGKFLIGVLWRVPVSCFMTWAGLVVLGGIIELLIYCAHTINLMKTRIFKVFPKELDFMDIKEKLDESVRASISIVLTISTIGVAPLILLKVIPLFWVICITMSGTMISIYGILLYKHRNLGIRAFYWLRKLVIPYLFMSALACVVALYAFFWVWYVHIHIRLSPIILLYPSTFKNIIQNICQTVPAPWLIPIPVVVEAIIWSLASALLVVWILPMVAKKDYCGLCLSGLIVAAPIMSHYFEIFSRVFSESILITLNHIPSPVLSFALLVLGCKVYDDIQAYLGRSIICRKCGARIKRTFRYCPICGSKNPESEK